MTDTELILSKIDELRTELKGEITDLRSDMDNMHTELKGEISDLRINMDDMHIELSGKIAALQISVGDLRERMDTMEFGPQTEIEKTYDLALTNAKNIRILVADRNRNQHGKSRIRLVTDKR